MLAAIFTEKPLPIALTPVELLNIKEKLRKDE